MIPDINSIVEMLIAGQCTAQQALRWLNTHMENADLRDHFAANVIADCLGTCSTKQRAAEEAYEIADAMLKAREQ